MAGVTVTLKITAAELDLIREALAEFRQTTLEKSHEPAADNDERASYRTKLLQIDDISRALLGQ